MAAALAQQHGAKLTGVDISTHAGFPRQVRRDRAAEIGDRFEAVARARGVPFRYRVAARELASNLFVHSADLFVATQPHVDTAGTGLRRGSRKNVAYRRGARPDTALLLEKERNWKARPGRMERVSRSHSRNAR